MLKDNASDSVSNNFETRSAPPNEIIDVMSTKSNRENFPSVIKAMIDKIEDRIKRIIKSCKKYFLRVVKRCEDKVIPQVITDGIARIDETSNVKTFSDNCAQCKNWLDHRIFSLNHFLITN